MRSRDPEYADDWRRLYSGDVREVTLPDEPISVVLTDPPYTCFKYIRTMEESGQLDPEADMRWCGGAFHWVGTWWWPLCGQLAPNADVWVFANIHYIGFYLRWGHLSQRHLRGFIPLQGEEVLLSFGSEALTPAQATALRQACGLNTYGQNKPLDFLRTLLSMSTPGLVLDPFAGLGSTLDAAKLEGRQSIGVEIQDDLVRRMIAKWTGPN